MWNWLERNVLNIVIILAGIYIGCVVVGICTGDHDVKGEEVIKKANDSGDTIRFTISEDYLEYSIPYGIRVITDNENGHEYIVVSYNAKAVAITPRLEKWGYE